MKTFTLLFSYLSILAVSLGCALAIANEELTPETFVDQASAKGIAEIEGGHIALRESSHPEVKRFARAMISEHSAINRKLIRLAQMKNIPVADEAELISKAKLNMLQVREGESFDIAYARQQLTAHEEVIALFQKAVFLKEKDISQFADKILPALREHMAMAEKLMAAVNPENIQLPPRHPFEHPTETPVESDQPVLQPAPRKIDPDDNTQPVPPADTIQ